MQVISLVLKRPATRVDPGGKRVRGNHLTPVEAATGTPAGVGMPRGEFLKAGDEVQIEIANCGRLRNRMITECERE
jgi:hypothetical protein